MFFFCRVQGRVISLQFEVTLLGLGLPFVVVDVEGPSDGRQRIRDLDDGQPAAVVGEDELADQPVDDEEHGAACPLQLRHVRPALSRTDIAGVFSNNIINCSVETECKQVFLQGYRKDNIGVVPHLPTTEGCKAEFMFGLVDSAPWLVSSSCRLKINDD